MLYPTFSLSDPERNPTLRFPGMLRGNSGHGRQVEIVRSHDQLAVRSNPGLRSVIGTPVLAGNAVAEMPVLFSDGPHRRVDDEEKQDDQDLFRCCYVTVRADRIAGLGAAHDRRAGDVCVLPSQWRSRHRIGTTVY